MFLFAFFLNIILFILFLAAVGLHCGDSFSLVAVSGGYSRVVMCRLLAVVASLAAKHGL